MFCERAVNLLPPSSCLPECQSHFSSSCVPLSQDCMGIEIIGLHRVRAGCQCTFPTEISSLVPLFPSDLPFTAPSSTSAHFPPRLRWVVTMTPASHYNDTAFMVHYLQWASRSGASSVCGPFFPAPIVSGISGSSLFNVAHIQKSQPQGAFIPPTEFNHFSLSSFWPSTELFRV